MYFDIANLLVFPFVFPSQRFHGWVAGACLPLHERDAVVGDCSKNNRHTGSQVVRQSGEKSRTAGSALL